MEENNRISFAVSLNREENAAFMKLMSRFDRQRTAQWFRVLIPVLLLINFLSLSFGTGEAIAGLTEKIVVGILVAIVMAVCTAIEQKRAVNRQYDQVLFSGYSFDGIVTVTEEEIEKQTATETNAVKFSECMLFAETASLFVFFGKGNNKAVVIPARCLTKEDAEFIRRTARKAVPQSAQQLKAMLVPQAENRLPTPDLTPAKDYAPLLTVPITYTKKEFFAMTADDGLSHVVHGIGGRCLFSYLFAILFMLNGQFLLLFVLAFFAFSLLSFVFYLVRVNSAVKDSEGKALSPTVRFTETHFVFAGNGEESRTCYVPWWRLTRAVEQKDAVDFYADTLIARIPKRCIDDMEEIRRIVDSHMAIYQ